jgi:hypothetical protein
MAFNKETNDDEANSPSSSKKSKGKAIAKGNNKGKGKEFATVDSVENDNPPVKLPPEVYDWMSTLPPKNISYMPKNSNRVKTQSSRPVPSHMEVKSEEKADNDQETMIYLRREGVGIREFEENSQVSGAHGRSNLGKKQTPPYARFLAVF